MYIYISIVNLTLSTFIFLRFVILACFPLGDSAIITISLSSYLAPTPTYMYNPPSSPSYLAHFSPFPSFTSYPPAFPSFTFHSTAREDQKYNNIFTQGTPPPPPERSGLKTNKIITKEIYQNPTIFWQLGPALLQRPLLFSIPFVVRHAHNITSCSSVTACCCMMVGSVRSCWRQENVSPSLI